jgi:hypothetical protein
MRRRAAALAIAALVVVALAGAQAGAQAADGFWLFCPDVRPLSCDEQPVPTVTGPTTTVTGPTTTVVSTVTVTAPTTTQPPPTTTEPPPSGTVVDVVVYTTLGWVCNGPVDIDLLRVLAPATTPTGAPSPNGNAVTLDPGCTGTIDRVEITTSTADGIKCRNNAVTNAHDLVVGGGFVRGIANSPGAHADGIQCMGGDRITFRNLLIDYRNRPGGGGFYPSLGGAGTGGQPEDVVCDGCSIIHGAASVRVDASVRSGVRNSILCDPAGAAAAAVATYQNPLTSPVGVSTWPVTIQRHDSANVGVLNSGNVAVASTDSRCSSEP